MLYGSLDGTVLWRMDTCIYTGEYHCCSPEAIRTLLIGHNPIQNKVLKNCMQKLLSLIRFHLFIFAIISNTLGGGSQRILLRFMSESVLPMFSSTNRQSRFDA